MLIHRGASLREQHIAVMGHKICKAVGSVTEEATVNVAQKACYQGQQTRNPSIMKLEYFLNWFQIGNFGGVEIFSVFMANFQIFLSALTSNNAFIVNLKDC